MKPTSTNTIFTTIAAAVIFLTGCAADTLTIAGRKYRTVGAPTVQLGATGYKVRAGKNSLYTTADLPDYLKDADQKLSMSIVTQQHSDTTRTAAGNVTASPAASGSLGDVTTAGIKPDYSKKVKGNFDLVVLREDLAKRLNLAKNAEVRNELARWGKEARVVTAIAVAYGHEKVVKFDTDSNITTKGSVVDLGVTIKTTSKTTTRLSDGTIYAYELSRPAWERGSDGTPRIVNLLPDRIGLGGPDMPGTAFDPAELK